MNNIEYFISKIEGMYYTESNTILQNEPDLYTTLNSIIMGLRKFDNSISLRHYSISHLSSRIIEYTPFNKMLNEIILNLLSSIYIGQPYSEGCFKGGITNYISVNINNPHIIRNIIHSENIDLTKKYINMLNRMLSLFDSKLYDFLVGLYKLNLLEITDDVLNSGITIPVNNVEYDVNYEVESTSDISLTLVLDYMLDEIIDNLNKIPPTQIDTIMMNICQLSINQMFGIKIGFITSSIDLNNVRYLNLTSDVDYSNIELLDKIFSHDNIDYYSMILDKSYSPNINYSSEQVDTMYLVGKIRVRFNIDDDIIFEYDISKLSKYRYYINDKKICSKLYFNEVE